MRRGFTLIEVIGVVIILGLISLLAFPPLLKLIKGTETELDDANKQLIYTASSQYVNKYNNDFELSNGSVYCLTIRDLVKEDFLSSNSKISLDSKVKVEVKEDKYNYSLDNECKGSSKLTELLISQYKDTNTVGLLKDGSNYYYKGTNTEVANNFVWYEGHLWRVIQVNSDNTITMMTQQPITSIAMANASWTNSKLYEDSYINDWLNNTFYNSIGDKSKIIKSTFNVGIYNNVSEITTNQYVGLIDIDQYKRTLTTDSYLNIKEYFRSGNRYDETNSVHINIDNTIQNGQTLGYLGVRPIISITDLAISIGDGSLKNPFREARKATNTDNIKVGEYISIPTEKNYCTVENGRCLFRVVSKDNDSIKVILNGLLPTKSVFDVGGNEVFNSSSTVNSVLTDFISNISSKYKVSNNKNFDIGEYNTYVSHRVVSQKKYSGIVGLPVIGEIFSGNDIDIIDLTKDYTFVNSDTVENKMPLFGFWMMNAAAVSDVRHVNENGYLNYGNSITTNEYGVRPTLFLNRGTSQDLTFTSGDGTAENPYKLGN